MTFGKCLLENYNTEQYACSEGCRVACRHCRYQMPCFQSRLLHGKSKQGGKNQRICRLGGQNGGQTVTYLRYKYLGNRSLKTEAYPGRSGE